MAPLATVGYEGATLAQVLARLDEAGVDLLIDVRALASSRRPGFSKTVLSASLGAAGIGYLHLRDLGTPRAGRVAVRAGRVDEMRAIYAEHLAGEAAQAALDQAVAVSKVRRACLLCFEHDWRSCHRAIVAEAIVDRTAVRVVHL